MREILILLSALAQITTTPTTETLSLSEEPVLFEPVDRNEYLLGPGDILQVTVYGGCTEVMLTSGVRPQSVCMISGDGYLSVSGLGQLDVMGISIAEAEEQLQTLARRFYPRITLGTALLEPRLVKAYIGGMVEAPGTYTVSAISRISDLVQLAGGLSSYSSRKGNMFTESGDTVSVDLRLDPVTHQRIADPFVTNNISVVFELCTDPVYILRAGTLFREDLSIIPSMETWDVDPDTDLEELLNSIGGLSGNVDLARSHLVRDGESFPVWSTELGLLETEVIPGDTISLVMLSDSITIGGATNRHERVAFRPGTTTREYIDRSGGFRYNSHAGGTRVYRNGEEIARGNDALDMVLLPGDVVEVPWSWIAKNAEWIRVLSVAITIVVMVDGLTN
jgi:protein involved in polysaccharide export with SLBB domain